MNDVSTLFEPRFLWSTRICAEAAKVALRDGKTLKERVEIYEREIAAAVAARQAAIVTISRGLPGILLVPILFYTKGSCARPIESSL